MTFGMEFKVTAIVDFAIVTLIVLVKYANAWSARLRRYMLDQATDVFGRGAGWEKPWALFLSKAMVYFFGLMFIVLVYVAIFSL
jgi:hypothetical protein